MLIAVNTTNQYIQAHEADKENTYRCPSCLETVMLKTGEIKQRHFAHLVSSNCNTLSENETKEHLMGKLQIANRLMRHGEVKIEAVLKGIKQRPDILLVKNNRVIAIEYQCSPISEKRLKERNQGYDTLNIEVIWILGDSYYFKNLTQATIMKFIDRREQLIFYLSSRQKFYYRGQFQKIDFQRLNFIETNYPLRTQPADYVIRTVEIEKQLYKLQTLLLQKRIDKALVNYLYQNKLSLLNAPIWIHCGSTFGLKIANWHWRLIAISLLREVGIGNKISLIKVVQQLKLYVLGTSNYQTNQVCRLLSDLERLNIVRIKESDLMIVNQFSWYDSFSEKLSKVREK
ncbi:competence protein CoiA [Leuconostoc palmae]|uniref:competence protein CoiA n=1 Tax=Leuconostoc palmae TaxID=501487 RepID=UPI001C7CA092|nr:competence protein CoiA family protein [Leuconostoc palmae]